MFQLSETSVLAMPVDLQGFGVFGKRLRASRVRDRGLGLFRWGGWLSELQVSMNRRVRGRFHPRSKSLGVHLDPQSM